MQSGRELQLGTRRKLSASVTTWTSRCSGPHLRFFALDFDSISFFTKKRTKKVFAMYEETDLIELRSMNCTKHIFVDNAENGPFKVAPVEREWADLGAQRSSRWEASRKMQGQGAPIVVLVLVPHVCFCSLFVVLLVLLVFIALVLASFACALSYLFLPSL